MKNIINNLLVFSLLVFLSSCGEENSITDNEPSRSDNIRLEKATIRSATGHGDVHYTADGKSYYQRFSFNAHDKNGEVKGILQYYDDEVNFTFKGDITCMTIEGNIAVMSGKILKYRWDREYQLPEELLYFWVKVVDNGEGNNSVPDQTSLVFAPIPFYPCDNWETALYSIENGNFQVKP